MSTLAAAWLYLGAHAAHAAAPAGCEAAATNDDVTVALEQATAAYGDLDFAAFEGGVGKATATASCLGEPMTRANAAEFHRSLGMLAFVQRDEDSSRKQFAAARAIEPKFTFPASLVPEGNPLLGFYTAIDPSTLDTEAVRVPAKGSLRLDGSAVSRRLVGLPVVLQVLDEDGAVALNALLGPNDPIPSLEPESEPHPDRKGPRTGPLIAGIGSMAASGLLLGLAADRYAKHQAEPIPSADKLNSLFVQNRAFAISGLGLAAAGVGLTTFSVVGRF
jgi:hypothetical protein